jgi:hypothetical protein
LWGRIKEVDGVGEFNYFINVTMCLQYNKIKTEGPGAQL